MKTITINTIPGFHEWRDVARQALAQKIPHHQIQWQTDRSTQTNLFDTPHPPKPNEQSEQPKNPIINQDVTASKNTNLKVSKSFLQICEHALCHTNENKFDLCYRLLWRLTHENKNLLNLKTDDDVMRITGLLKAVRRDAYKITAFLRFREVNYGDVEQFIAWYEPEHYTLELKLDFFKTRFKNMRWSILTPYRAAHWDTKTLLLEDNPDPSAYPQNDKIEQYWLTYYANIFNPARPKKSAMLSQMPKKYWKNMPETALINDLLKTSEARARAMISNHESSKN